MNKLSRKSIEKKNMTVKSKHTQLCSTPEPVNQPDSPSHDDSCSSLCGSEDASPIPFLCTQDGIRGDTAVIWNYYTPKADNTSTPNKTPLSRKSKRVIKARLIVEKPISKPIRSTQKKTQLLQGLKAELMELNENLKHIIDKKCESNEGFNCSDDDIFNNSFESPKSAYETLTNKSNSRCLRRNLLSSKFAKTDPDNALESDDSMNEFLIRASQIVEENVDVPAQRKVKKLESNNSFSSVNLKNDTFDNIVCKMNDSDIERLSQLPIKDSPVACKPISYKSNSEFFNTNTNAVSTELWTIKETSINAPSPRSSFSRHSSMPVSSHFNIVWPSTSGTSLSRHNSLPLNKDKATNSSGHNAADSSPIRCTQDEIQRKHQLAKEKLLAKRTLQFTQTSNTNSQQQATKGNKKYELLPNTSKQVSHNFDSNFKISSNFGLHNINRNINELIEKKGEKPDLRFLIEKKRQEAVMKLKRKRSQNNLR